MWQQGLHNDSSRSTLGHSKCKGVSNTCLSVWIRKTNNWPRIFIAFAAVAIWSAVPLTFRLFVTFQQRKGTYFWAILICSWGLCIRQTGYMLGFLAGNPYFPLPALMEQVGWVMMVSGFAVVLYSRLNLIVNSKRILRALLCLIIFNAVVWHPMMSTLSIGQEALGRKHRPTAKWARVFFFAERVQIIMFCGQEILMSMFYVRAAYEFLRTKYDPSLQHKVRKAMFLLLFSQGIVTSLDITIITIDFLGYQSLKLFIHSFIYSVKLEMEFIVLNQLVELSKEGIRGLNDISLKTQDTYRGSERGSNGKTKAVTPLMDPHDNWNTTSAFPEQRLPRMDSISSTVVPSSLPSPIARSNSVFGHVSGPSWGDNNKKSSTSIVHIP